MGFPGNEWVVDPTYGMRPGPHDKDKKQVLRVHLQVPASVEGPIGMRLFRVAVAHRIPGHISTLRRGKGICHGNAVGVSKAQIYKP